MKHVKLLSAALFAALALAGVLASSAFALPVLLPTPSAGTPLNFEGKGASGVLETLAGGLAISCTGVTLKGSFTSAAKGTTTLDFSGCNAAGKCQTPGDAAGVILVGPNETHLVFDKLASEGELGVGVLLLGISLHITCSTIVGNVLILVRGNVLGLVKPINTKTKTAEVIFKQTAGDQAEKKWWNEAGTEQTSGLETSVSEKAFESSGDESTLTKIEKFSGASTEPEIMG